MHIKMEEVVIQLRFEDWDRNIRLKSVSNIIPNMEDVHEVYCFAGRLIFAFFI